MSDKKLSTAKEILGWASGISPVPHKWQIPGAEYVAGVPVGEDTETADYLAECVRLRQIVERWVDDADSESRSYSRDILDLAILRGGK